MVLICECDHPRKEHLGGTLYIPDRKIEHCSHPNCTCKHYRGDLKTRKTIDDVYLNCVLRLIGISAVIIFGLVLAGIMNSLAIDTFDVKSKITPKLFFENGTEYKNHLYNEPPESLKQLINAGLIMIGFGVIFGICLVYGQSFLDNRFKELIKE